MKNVCVDSQDKTDDCTDGGLDFSAMKGNLRIYMIAGTALGYVSLIMMFFFKYNEKEEKDGEEKEGG